jgi:hypothetical protein
MNIYARDPRRVPSAAFDIPRKGKSRKGASYDPFAPGPIVEGDRLALLA